MLSIDMHIVSSFSARFQLEIKMPQLGSTRLGKFSARARSSRKIQARTHHYSLCMVRFFMDQTLEYFYKIFVMSGSDNNEIFFLDLRTCLCPTSKLFHTTYHWFICSLLKMSRKLLLHTNEYTRIMFYKQRLKATIFRTNLVFGKN